MTRRTPEWIGKTDDTPVPARIKDRVRSKDGDACRGCGRPLRGESAQYDHVTAIINGGENRESNLQTLCLVCHGVKTKTDVAQKSRSYKRRKRHRGIHRAKQPIKGWRRFDGTPVFNPKLRRRTP